MCKQSSVNLLSEHNPGLNSTKAELKKHTYFLLQGTFSDQIDHHHHRWDGFSPWFCPD